MSYNLNTCHVNFAFDFNTVISYMSCCTPAKQWHSCAGWCFLELASERSATRFHWSLLRLYTNFHAHIIVNQWAKLETVKMLSCVYMYQCIPGRFTTQAWPLNVPWPIVAKLPDSIWPWIWRSLIATFSTTGFTGSKYNGWSNLEDAIVTSW